MDHRSMMRAERGRNSLMMIPGTAVLMWPNSPRYSSGASGLGSQVSCWAGPPRIQRMMTELARFGLAPAAAAIASLRNNCDRLNPPTASIPAFSNPLRLRASARRAWWKLGQPRRDWREEGMASLFKPLALYLVELFQGTDVGKPE